MKQDTPFDVSSEIVMRKISEIKPYVRNPRKNTKTVDLLVEIIPKVGFNVPIVIDNKGIIVKGHARYCAAIRLGMKEVPCVITEADEETIKLDRLTDNRISEFSEWIDEELLHELDSLNLDYDLDFESFGFELPDFDIPEEDSFEAEDGESDEDRRHRYEEYLDEMSKKEPKGTEIVSQARIDRAKEAKQAIAQAPPKYYKVVCEHCGHIMFIKEDSAVLVDENCSE